MLPGRLFAYTLGVGSKGEVRIESYFEGVDNYCLQLRQRARDAARALCEIIVFAKNREIGPRFGVQLAST